MVIEYSCQQLPSSRKDFIMKVSIHSELKFEFSARLFVGCLVDVYIRCFGDASLISSLSSRFYSALQAYLGGMSISQLNKEYDSGELF